MLDSVRERVAALFARALSAEEGQTLVEYALILVLIAIASVAALGFLSDAIDGVLTSAKNEL